MQTRSESEIYFQLTIISSGLLKLKQSNGRAIKLQANFSAHRYKTRRQLMIVHSHSTTSMKPDEIQLFKLLSQFLGRQHSPEPKITTWISHPLVKRPTKFTAIHKK